MKWKIVLVCVVGALLLAIPAALTLGAEMESGITSPSDGESLRGEVAVENGHERALVSAADGGPQRLAALLFFADALADGRLVRILEGRERSPLTLSVLYPSRQHVPAKTRLFNHPGLEQFAQAGGGRAASLCACECRLECRQPNCAELRLLGCIHNCIDNRRIQLILLWPLT